ncbi:hypothetical protein RAA17_21815 [Komagataeibacter rhaeticus]|nr:hypothetical protein [Komagataeibacter rhaeticus]
MAPCFFLINQSGSSWRVFWMICCCAALVIGGAAAFSTHGCHFRQDDDTENAATSTTGGWSTRAALATPQFWIIIAAYTTCLLINTTVHTFAVQHFREQGLTLGRAATLISMGALVGAVASTLAGLCGEKVDARKLTLLSLGSLGLAATCLLFPRLHWHCPVLSSAWVLAWGPVMSARPCCCLPISDAAPIWSFIRSCA